MQVDSGRDRSLGRGPLRGEVLEVDNEHPLRPPPSHDRQRPNTHNHAGSAAESGGDSGGPSRPSMRLSSSAASSWERVRRDGAAAALTAATTGSIASARGHAPASSWHTAAATDPPAAAAPVFPLSGRPPPPPPLACHQAPLVFGNAVIGSAVTGRRNAHFMPGPEEGPSRGQSQPRLHSFAAFGGQGNATAPFTLMNLGSSR